MKTLKLTLVFGVLIGLATCGNPREGQDSAGADSLFGDSTASDSATWDITKDTTEKTTDSLASPSFP